MMNPEQESNLLSLRHLWDQAMASRFPVVAIPQTPTRWVDVC